MKLRPLASRILFKLRASSIGLVFDNRWFRSLLRRGAVARARHCVVPGQHNDGPTTYWFFKDYVSSIQAYSSLKTFHSYYSSNESIAMECKLILSIVAEKSERPKWSVLWMMSVRSPSQVTDLGNWSPGRHSFTVRLIPMTKNVICVRR